MIQSKIVYPHFKEDSITGRYVVNEQIIDFLKTKCTKALVDTAGYSVQNRPIQSVTIGTGKHKLLLWSQMHGNESTTTKAVIDLLNFLHSDSTEAIEILKNCTLRIIPILNPDGAAAYTRVNANHIDLNRDAQDRSQPESQVLRAVYEDFQPDFCFNLHDQRTIFSAGGVAKPATVSFLAPAFDEARSISTTRAKSMQLIVAMNKVLQNLIPNQVGRYDDGFNANCVGDTFQMLHTPTILFEAGHYQKDYQREKTREYIFWALLTGIECIVRNEIANFSQEAYFFIPENQKLFYDILIKNANLINSAYTNDVAIMFVEVLQDDKIAFEVKVEKTENLQGFYGHESYDCMISSDLSRLKAQPFWKDIIA